VLAYSWKQQLLREQSRSKMQFANCVALTLAAILYTLTVF